MTVFSKMFEDPMYDEDGILIDEDAEWEDIQQEVEDYDPFSTVNS
jgi:hypothetical protein